MKGDPNAFLDEWDAPNTSLSMAVLEEAISLAAPRTYPKSIKVSYSDYRWLVQSLTPATGNFGWHSLYGMMIVPDINIVPGTCELEY